MTESFFISQMNRLKIRFGAKAFDSEFIRLLGLEVVSISDEFFRRTIDTWIGTRKNNNPPLLTDFKEARLAFDKDKFIYEVEAVNHIWQSGLKEILWINYKVATITEAIEMEKLKIRLEGAHEEKGIK